METDIDDNKFPEKMAMRIDELIRKCPTFSGDPARVTRRNSDLCNSICPVYRRCWELQDKDPEDIKNGMKLLETVEEEM